MIEYSLVIPTVGANGAATGTLDSPNLDGLLLGFMIKYGAAIPVTTVITIVEVGGAARTLLTLTGNTNGYFPVMLQAVGATGVALSGVYVNPPLGHPLRVTVTLSNALADAVSLWLYLLE